VRYGAWTVAALGLLVLDARAGEVARKPKTHTVVMTGVAFEPASLTVASGDSVVWVNKDPFPHTATSKAGNFDSQSIASGESWKYVAQKKGDFPYICTLHVTMKGVLRVK
jgi:plastocyanin